MNKLVQAFLVVLFATGAAYAQPRPNMEQIHAAKVAYVVDRLHLKTDQFKNFMPLYEDYENEIIAVRQTFRKKYMGADRAETNDMTPLQWIDDNLDYQQQIIDIKRTYNDRFLKVISQTQLSTLYQAEREFKQILLKRLEQRRRRGEGY
jgi:hypothetical protein